MLKYFLFILLLSVIKSETWEAPVWGFDQNDWKNGIAGRPGYSITGFYLCGGRNYRVHYLGDPKDSWTGEYSWCDPVGLGKPIDGIAISGGKWYGVRRKKGKWIGNVNGYDIKDSKNGYAGILGVEIDAIIVQGGDEYRICHGGTSSVPEQVANRVVNNIFGVSKSYNYDWETTVVNNRMTEVKVKLMSKWNINYDGAIKFVIENNSLKEVDWGGLIGDDLYKSLKEAIGFDINNVKYKFEKGFTEGMANGNVVINIYWVQRKIEIDTGIKITKDSTSIRNGFRITIHIKDNDDIFGKIKKVIKIFVFALGEFLNNILRLMTSFSFGNFEQIPQLIPQAVMGQFIAIIFVLMLGSALAL